MPVWRPLRLASLRFVKRAREWITCGFLITKPSFTSFLMFWRELARAISFDSFGSSQILRLPHLSTDAARLTERERKERFKKGVCQQPVLVHISFKDVGAGSSNQRTASGV
uniref:Uncharacterized protein n=1 Tax=Peronospora matthiolae TaxID=2874970 RepID=A0AAV1UNV2_9STRA